MPVSMAALNISSQEAASKSLTDLGALPVYYTKKCVDASRNTVKLLLQKLADPAGLFSFQMSGALVDAAKKSGAAGLQAYAAGYLKRNASNIALGVLSGPTTSNFIRDALNTVYSALSTAFLAGNTIIYLMMKIVCKNCVDQINRKRTRLVALRKLFMELYNTLFMLSKGDPLYNEYLDKLKSAMTDVLAARANIINVRTGLTRNVYLSKQFISAQTYMASAQHKIRPSTGGNPFTGALFGGQAPVGQELNVLGERLLSAYGVPTKPEQFDNMLRIPALSGKIISSMKDYSTLVLSINGYLDSFYLGTDALIKGFFKISQSLMLDQLDSIAFEMKTLATNMSTVLFPKAPVQSEKASGTLITPFSQFSDAGIPSPAKVTANAFKWTLDCALILAHMRLFPTKSAAAVAQTMKDLAIYDLVIAELRAMDTIGTGNARLVATDAKEDIGSLESQMLTVLLTANAAVATASINPAVLSLIKSIIRRLDLTMVRDDQIKASLNKFITYQFEGEAALQKMLNSVLRMMQASGLDRMHTLFQNGDWTQFFGLNPKTATWVGAGLQAIALLKSCFNTVEEQQDFTKLERTLEREQDLLNIKLSFNFDIGIAENIKICKEAADMLRITGTKEFICRLAERAGIGKIFEALADACTVPDMDDALADIGFGDQDSILGGSTLG